MSNKTQPVFSWQKVYDRHLRDPEHNGGQKYPRGSKAAMISTVINFFTKLEKANPNQVFRSTIYHQEPDPVDRHDRLTLDPEREFGTFTANMVQRRRGDDRYRSTSGAFGSSDQFLNDFSELIAQWLGNGNQQYTEAMIEITKNIFQTSLYCTDMHSWLTPGNQQSNIPTMVEIHLHMDDPSPQYPDGQFVVVFHVPLYNRYY